MKILVILDPTVPISKYDTVGSTNATCQLCKELSVRGLDITLGGNWDTYDCEMSQFVTPLNIYPEITRVYMKKAFEIINEHLDNNTYDAINLNVSTPGAAKYLIDLRNKDIPVYFTMHSWTGTSAVSFHYKNEFTRLIDEDKLKFIFLCDSQMKTLFKNIERSPKNYYVIPNAVRTEKYNITEEESQRFIKSILPQSFTDKYVLTVARLVKSKHVSDIIDAVLLTDQKLVIIGKEWINDTEYAADVKKKVAEHPDQLFLIDELSNRNTAMVIKEASCTVLFTDMEVCNLTVLESCLLGTPIVVGPSNGTGITDSIDNLSYENYESLGESQGVYPIEFPYRSSWTKKLESLSNTIVEASNHGKYEISKFPDYYRWDNYINTYYNLLTKGDI